MVERKILMGIDIKFEPSSNYIDDRIEVYANDVCIGTLSSSEAMPDQLVWNPNDKVYNIRFQFRNPQTFLSIVHQLKLYKSQHGYKYLTIYNYGTGYVALLDEELLKKAGFEYLPEISSECMFLE
jgi:hypothetical protein